MKNAKLTIEFPNEALLKDFASWLCNQGEQDYFAWADIQGHENPVTRVQYHSEDLKYPSNSPKRYGPFLKDNIIIAQIEETS